MDVDYERAWLRLKAEVVKKGSHGKRDLLAVMGEIEVECALPEFDPHTGEHVRPGNGSVAHAGSGR